VSLALRTSYDFLPEDLQALACSGGFPGSFDQMPLPLLEPGA
jgi:hypothetical protein